MCCTGTRTLIGRDSSRANGGVRLRQETSLGLQFASEDSLALSRERGIGDDYYRGL